MANTINWCQCILCRKSRNEPLVCPANSKRSDAGAGYRSLALNLSEIEELGESPFDFNINELDSGNGIELTLKINNACWHKSCRNQINSAKIKRAVKRKNETEVNSSQVSPTKTRRSSGASAQNNENTEKCFFCDQADDVLHKVSTFQIDNKVRKFATELNDTKLLSKLAAGDMVAIDTTYHKKCIVAFYNRARKHVSGNAGESEKSRLYAIAFAELVSYVEQAKESQDSRPLFTLAELSKLFSSILEDLGLDQESRVHTTRL